MLSSQDINQLLRNYSYVLQQRMEELDHIGHPCSTSDCSIDCTSNDSYIKKYEGYTTTNEWEIKLIGKLVERLLQIYDFFKKKSNSQNLLTSIQARITKDFQTILAKGPLNVGEVFDYVQVILKKGAVIKLPVQSRRTYSKSMFKDCRIESKIVVREYVRAAKSKTFLQNRASSATGAVRGKINPLVWDRNRIDQLVQDLYGVIDYDKNHFVRIIESPESNLTREMIRKNQKIGASIRRYEREFLKGRDGQAAKKEALLELKPNEIAAANIWPRKKRIPLVLRRRGILKQNISQA